MTDPPIAVKKWGHAVEMAEAPCGGCGQPMRYNLSARVLGHVEEVDGCDEPWPHEPMPEWVRAEIAQQRSDWEAIKRGVDALERRWQDWLGDDPMKP